MRRADYLFPLGGLVAALGLWVLLPLVGLAHPLYLPSPGETFRAGLSLIRDEVFWTDIGSTLRRALEGLLLAAVVGVPAGLVLGVVRAAYKVVSIPVDFVRSIPAAALLPLFIVYFGIGDGSKVAVVFFGCVFVFLIPVLYAARGTPETQARRDALRTMGASALQELRFVIIPESLLTLASSLRLAVSYALVLTVFTEMFLGSEDGLGRRLIDMYLSFRIPAMYFYIVALGTIGASANRLLELLERRYLALRR